MSGQEAFSFIVVAAAVFYLIWHFSRSKKKGCGGDCSCDDKIMPKSPQKH